VQSCLQCPSCVAVERCLNVRTVIISLETFPCNISFAVNIFAHLGQTDVMQSAFIWRRHVCAVQAPTASNPRRQDARFICLTNCHFWVATSAHVSVLSLEPTMYEQWHGTGFTRCPQNVLTTYGKKCSHVSHLLWFSCWELSHIGCFKLT
jgi:hypothetical protein